MEKIMNKLSKISMTVSLAAMLGLPMAQTASAASVEGAVSKLIDSMHKKIKNSSEFQAKFCRKADLFSGVFSVRSLSGIACEDKSVAAMAEITCKDYADYNASQCRKNAEKALGEEGMKDPMKVLKEETTKRAGNAQKLLCGKTDNLTGVLQSAATAACKVPVKDPKKEAEELKKKQQEEAALKKKEKEEAALKKKEEAAAAALKKKEEAAAAALKKKEEAAAAAAAKKAAKAQPSKKTSPAA
jgi:hypothetical protein